MATEQEYDDIIGPQLLSVAQLCQDMGFSIVCRVEWDGDQGAITQVMDEKPSTAQRLTQLVMHSQGNIDAFLIEVLKRFDTSQSIYLRQFQLQAAPQRWRGEARTEAVAAIRTALKEEYQAHPDVAPDARAHAAAVTVLQALEGLT